ncbi:MAG: hypothetical protein BWY94_02283 [Actinobacteria bacterium ADurb.BinA094]|nr:MAG: hypothetical protein BWY94_02283 [Actinobacteria bacterium ADurb.BinA094]
MVTDYRIRMSRFPRARSEAYEHARRGVGMSVREARFAGHRPSSGGRPGGDAALARRGESGWAP